MNNNEQNLYDNLEQKHQKAIDFRLLGYSYHLIAQQQGIGVTEHTVRTWFMAGGICQSAYEQVKRQRLDERKAYYSELEEQIREIGQEAVLGLRESVRNGHLSAILRALELSGISKAISYSQQSQSDEAISLMREIIEDRRAQAKRNRENTP